MMTQFRKPAAVMLLLSTAACTSLQPVMEPTGFFQQQAPAFVVVTTTEGEESADPLVLQSPRLESGTLTGTFEGERISLPMTRVRTVSAVQRDRKKTLFAILGAGVAAGLVTYLVVGNGSSISNDRACIPEGYRSDLPYC